ncbi:small heat shock protein, chloroplastic isoform X1, partial [Tanacetum coccineum]
ICLDRFSTTSRRTYASASLTPEQKTPNSSKSKDKDNLKLRVSVPGLEKEDVKATVKFDTPSLVIDAEKVMKDFELRKYSVKFDIPNDINVTGIKQVMKAGILKVTLPKLKKEEMPNLNSDDEILIKIS